MTRVSNNLEEKTDVEPCDTKDCFKAVVSYNGVALEQLVSLVDSSQKCWQSFKVKNLADTFQCVHNYYS